MEITREKLLEATEFAYTELRKKLPVDHPVLVKLHSAYLDATGKVIEPKPNKADRKVIQDQVILDILPLGEEVHIATSEYSIDHTDRWKPIAKVHHMKLRSLKKRGLIDARFFWRGAAVTRLK